MLPSARRHGREFRRCQVSIATQRKRISEGAAAGADAQRTSGKTRGGVNFTGPAVPVEPNGSSFRAGCCSAQPTYWWQRVCAALPLLEDEEHDMMRPLAVL
jgi:hypothetical protein